MNLIWFRNDLRIDDNPALNAALTSCHSCCAVYISTPKQWQRHGMAHIKADLINRHLKLLNQQLA
ncbi:MAG: deoxyribodipyrimidine photo-lyase, partial [Vibrio sp.]